MKAYNYLDIDENNKTLTIEDEFTIYQYYEPNKKILENCEDWNYYDIKNYMKYNEPYEIENKII